MSSDNRSGTTDGGLAILLALGAAVLVVHLLTGGLYGFHRDELATLDDARHLAWGYVAYPPVTPFFGWISLKLFGTSLTGFRFFAAVSTSVAIVLTGLMARALGGKTGTQALAASAAIPHRNPYQQQDHQYICNDKPPCPRSAPFAVDRSDILYCSRD